MFNVKFIALTIVLVAIICNSAVIPKKKHLARSVLTETVQLEIEYFGTCKDFQDHVLSTIRISNVTTCLPLDSTFNEIDIYHTHYFCSDTTRRRSLVHFVEIFEVNDTTTVSDWVLSFVPAAPFRVLTLGVNKLRRPSCTATTEYCDPNNQFVTSCTDNNVTEHRGIVVNMDRVYLFSNNGTSSTCRDSQTCCSYIGAGTSGICPYTAPAGLFSLAHQEHHNDHYQHGDSDYDKRKVENKQK